MNSRLMVLIALSCPSQIGTAVRIRIGAATGAKLYLQSHTRQSICLPSNRVNPVNPVWNFHERSTRFFRQSRPRHRQLARDRGGDDESVWGAGGELRGQLRW